MKGTDNETVLTPCECLWHWSLLGHAVAAAHVRRECISIRVCHGRRWLAPLYSMRSLRLLRCRGVYHVNTAVFAAHPYLRVYDSEYDIWQAPPLLGEEEEE